MLTEKEINLIDDLMLNEISESEFYNNYPINLREDKEYFLNQMHKSIQEKKSESLSSSLDAMALLEEYKTIDHQEIYKKLILQNWHNLHEELVDSIEKKSSNEDLFYHVLNQVYEYHKGSVEDFMVPIWNKCLWSLYKIGNEKAINYIKEFSNSEYKYLRGTAKDLLSR